MYYAELIKDNNNYQGGAIKRGNIVKTLYNLEKADVEKKKETDEEMVDKLLDKFNIDNGINDDEDYIIKHKYDDEEYIVAKGEKQEKTEKSEKPEIKEINKIYDEYKKYFL